MKLYDNDAYRDEFVQAVHYLLGETNDKAAQIIAAFDTAPSIEAIPAPQQVMLSKLDRLTYKSENDEHWYLKDGICVSGFDKLAAYENTGLSPEEVKLMKGSWRAVCKEYGLNGFTMKEDHDGQVDN